jgi:hypothetical protein
VIDLSNGGSFSAPHQPLTWLDEDGEVIELSAEQREQQAATAAEVESWAKQGGWI